ncbi:metal-dependent hydrolase [candidate division KSB1 bacterium]|nr:metal-dependent hydrolase [candidate division KSB1 bacterium]
MPTPVAHALCGYVCHQISTRRGERWQIGRILGLIVVANLADLDYLPGAFINQPNSFHHGMTHSLTFAVLFGLLAGAVGYVWKRQFWSVAIIMTVTYASHILLDFFTMDTAEPFGEQLLWPFSSAYFLSPIALFRDIDKGGTNATFFLRAFGLYNLKTVALECAIFAPIIFIIRYMKVKFNGKRQ